MEKQLKQQEPIQPTNISSVDLQGGRTYLYERQTQDLSDQVFADGAVTRKEMLSIQANHDEIIRDFLCACDMLDKMEKNPNQYTNANKEAMRFIVEHLLRAKEKSYAMMNKASYYNHIPPHEKRRRQQRRKDKEYLDIDFNLHEFFGFAGSARAVIQYARQKEQARMMNPLDVKATEKRLTELANDIAQKGRKTKTIDAFIRQEKTERQKV